ncbi:MAG TPA: hypothetical protein VEZ72_24315 [Paenibacillus sp.]|nr:hypothetical protein [Paenibacillus sp.]
MRGEAGCDTVRIGGRLRRPLAELRPAPAAGPAELLARLRGLLRRADRTAAPGLRWLAGAMPVPGLPLGGHVHLSGAPVTVRLLRALDSVAALPFALAADPRGDRRRPRYGALGDFRRQAHGGFEYRTLPSWLVSPTAAAGALSLALLAAREAYRGLPPVLPAEREAAVEAFYAGDRTALRGMLDEICGMIAATASYAELSRWIDPFLEAVRSGRTWDETADIRGKWRIGAGSARRRASMPRG